ncbi:hypothetical protein FGO68_gene7891 [Halteria grandinella]|uniref:Transmembrane protein n=1 Tax=Halteria grandinella TaxID=5974 RepID=A0A8J8T7I4_HALGN|nr:hypothetical protein FGO68_gene7891 [Halteria grandinella]
MCQVQQLMDIYNEQQTHHKSRRIGLGTPSGEYGLHHSNSLGPVSVERIDTHKFSQYVGKYIKSVEQHDKELVSEHSLQKMASLQNEMESEEKANILFQPEQQILIEQLSKQNKSANDSSNNKDLNVVTFGKDLQPKQHIDTEQNNDKIKQAVLMRHVTDRKFTKLNRWAQFKENFKLIDLFGSQINFTYTYQETYKTLEGALLTLIIVLILLVITLTQFASMAQKTEYNLNANTQFSDLSQDSEEFTFSSNYTFNGKELGQESRNVQGTEHFQFAFFFTDLEGNLLDIEIIRRHIEIRITHKQGMWEQLTKRRTSQTLATLDYQKCGRTFKATASEYLQAPIEQSFCLLPNQSWSIKGNYYAQDFKYLNMRILKCKNSTLSSTICADPVASKSFLEKTKMSIIYTNSMFNSTNMETPVVSAVSDQVYYTFLPTFSKLQNIFIKRQEGSLKDNIWLTTKKTIFFYAVDYVQEIMQILQDDVYLNIYFRKDNNHSVFERRVQTFYDWVAYVGGFWKAIFAVGFLLSQLFSYQIFVKSIMKRLYFIEDANEFKKETQVMRQSFKQSKVLGNDPNEKTVNRYLSVLGQKTETANAYGFTDSIAFYLFSKIPAARKLFSLKFKRHQLFMASYQKILQEMDVISFIRNQRYLTALMEIFLSKRESKIMLRLRQVNVFDEMKKNVLGSSQLHKYLNFGHSTNVSKVSRNYVDQFFKLHEVRQIILDVQEGNATEKELALLRYLGLQVSETRHAQKVILHSNSAMSLHTDEDLMKEIEENNAREYEDSIELGYSNKQSIAVTIYKELISECPNRQLSMPHPNLDDIYQSQEESYQQHHIPQQFLKQSSKEFANINIEVIKPEQRGNEDEDTLMLEDQPQKQSRAEDLKRIWLLKTPWNIENGNEIDQSHDTKSIQLEFDCDKAPPQELNFSFSKQNIRNEDFRTQKLNSGYNSGKE